MDISKEDQVNILVTGAAGLVGSHLVDRLLLQGHDVIGADNYFRGTEQSLNWAMQQRKFHFVKGDILEISKWGLPKVDQIYHLAAIVPTRYFYDAPIDSFMVNAVGTKHVLDFAKETGVKKVLHASSSEVYGQPTKVPTPETAVSHLQSPDVTTRWSYAVGKLAGEHLAQAYSRWFDVVVSVRYANVYGPRDIGEEHIIPYAIHRSLNGEPITLHRGADRRRRTFLHADDCARGTQLALEKGENGMIFNLGSDEEITVLDLVKRIMAMCGTRVDIGYDAKPIGDPNRRLLDLSKAERVLGFRPEVSLDQGLRSTLDWIRNGQ
jgi:nucleoside-diphosphate-sugar epimerase